MIGQEVEYPKHKGNIVPGSVIVNKVNKRQSVPKYKCTAYMKEQAGILTLSSLLYMWTRNKKKDYSTFHEVV
jgi:hypothetical protein